MGIWKRIMDRIRKGKQEEKPEETPDPELEERSKKIVVRGIDMGKAGGDIKWSFANQIPVGQDILKEAGVKAGRVTLGIPGMARAKKIITEYYMGK